MLVFGASANVRRDISNAVGGAVMIGRFSLENSTHVEKAIQITVAQAYERAASKRMAAIGGEMGERALMARDWAAFGQVLAIGQVLAAP